MASWRARLRFSKHIEQPCEADIHHRGLGSNGIEPEAIQRQRRLQAHDPEARRVRGGEPSRQRGDQIGLRDDSEREREIRNRQRDPSRSAARGDLEKIGKNDDAIAGLIRCISKEIGPLTPFVPSP